MKLNNLKPAKGSIHSRRRIGRGPGSGLGGTSTRGHKGAKSRSGYKHKVGFAINLSVLQELAEAKNLTVISPVELREAGYSKAKGLVKILGNGELKAKLEVKAHAFSKTAKEAIEAVGGITTII